MSRRDRLIALAVVAVVHLAVFVPALGSQSSLIDRGFWPQAERIDAGELPYRDVNFEYPPLALPLVLAPVLSGNSLGDYRRDFQLEQLIADLAILAMLALLVPGPARRVLGALGVYTAGVIAVSGVLLWDSSIEVAPLALARFDLFPAALILAALLARSRARSVLWGGALGVATAIKAFPLLLIPSLARGEKRPWRVAAAFAVPLLAAAAIVVFSGDEFSSAINYHSDRDLQIETVAATPVLVGHQVLGTAATVTVSGGSFNIDAAAAPALRAISVLLLLAAIGLILFSRRGRRDTEPFTEVTALLAVIIAFAPVLSPQFLLWVLPASAVAHGLGRENLTLIACMAATQDMLHNYIGVEGLEAPFIWSLTVRNALLLAYVILVLLPVLRPSPVPSSRG